MMILLPQTHSEHESISKFKLKYKKKLQYDEENYEIDQNSVSMSIVETLETEMLNNVFCILKLNLKCTSTLK